MKMLIRQLRDAAAARRARQKPDLQQIRLIHIFNGNGFFANCCSKRFNADRTSSICRYNCLEYLPVNIVESKLIYIKRSESLIRHLASDAPIRTYLREITHTAQHTVCNAWRAARTFRNFIGAFRRNGNA